jgi:hypothetical protein
MNPPVVRFIDVKVVHRWGVDDLATPRLVVDPGGFTSRWRSL